MAEEKLTLIDNMSPTLRRIYEHMTKLNKEILTLKANNKSLETTSAAIHAQARAMGARYGAFRFSEKNKSYYSPMGGRIPRAQELQYAQSYLANLESGRQRRLKLLEASRSELRDKISSHFQAMPSLPSITNLNTHLLRFGLTLSMVTGSLRSLYDTVHSVVIKQGDEYVGNITRVALTSDKKYTPTEMMSKLYDTAIRTRADATGTISLYNRIAMSGVKASNDRILRFVETFNKTMAVSGTTAQENRAVMLQLAQGLGSNRLGGDEFRSIAEQAPMFKWMLAEGLGVNPGALKEMGAQGKLTAEVIIKAMEKVQGQVDEIFKRAPWTIGQLLIVLQDKWQKVISENLTGYIKLRDLVKDFVMWLDTAEGQKFIDTLIDSVNFLITTFTNFVRKIAPFLLKIIEHIKQIYKFLALVITLIAASKVPLVIGTVLKLVGTLTGGMGTLISVTGLFIDFATTGFTALAVMFGLTVGQLGAIAAAIIAIITAMVAFKHVKDSLDPTKIKLKQQQKNARMHYERELNQEIRNQVGYKPYFGHDSKLTPEQQQAQIDEWNIKMYKALKRKGQIMRQWDIDANQGIFRKFSKEDMTTPEQKALQEINEATKPFYGAMNSLLNKPMPVESKKGKLDSVGRIDEDVNLNTDSIQMMKAIAERQWIVQNEVMVPQKVEMNVDKSTNMDPNAIADMLNTGMQLAIASSMRGEAMS